MASVDRPSGLCTPALHQPDDAMEPQFHSTLCHCAGFALEADKYARLLAETLWDSRRALSTFSPA
jgi:hypothetical protein